LSILCRRQQEFQLQMRH